MFDTDFSLDHGYARAFGARVHGKDGSGNGHRAIRRAHVQMAGMPFRGLHDDAALVEMNGGVTAACTDGQFRALVHFHLGAVKEPNLRMGIGRGADKFTFGDLIAEFYGMFAVGTDPIGMSLDRIDTRAIPGRPGKVPITSSPDQSKQ